MDNGLGPTVRGRTEIDFGLIVDGKTVGVRCEDRNERNKGID